MKLIKEVIFETNDPGIKATDLGVFNHSTGAFFGYDRLSPEMRQMTKEMKSKPSHGWISSSIDYGDTGFGMHSGLRSGAVFRISRTIKSYPVPDERKFREKLNDWLHGKFFRKAPNVSESAEYFLKVGEINPEDGDTVSPETKIDIRYVNAGVQYVTTVFGEPPSR